MHKRYPGAGSVMFSPAWMSVVMSENTEDIAVTPPDCFQVDFVQPGQKNAWSMLSDCTDLDATQWPFAWMSHQRRLGKPGNIWGNYLLLKKNCHLFMLVESLSLASFEEKDEPWKSVFAMTKAPIFGKNKQLPLWLHLLEAMYHRILLLVYY